MDVPHACYILQASQAERAASITPTSASASALRAEISPETSKPSAPARASSSSRKWAEREKLSGTDKGSMTKLTATFPSRLTTPTCVTRQARLQVTLLVVVSIIQWIVSYEIEQTGSGLAVRESLPKSTRASSEIFNLSVAHVEGPAGYATEVVSISAESDVGIAERLCTASSNEQIDSNACKVSSSHEKVKSVRAPDIGSTIEWLRTHLRHDVGEGEVDTLKPHASKLDRLLGARHVGHRLATTQRTAVEEKSS